MTIVSEIEAYAEKHAIAPQRVTRLAVNDSALYTRLKAESTKPTVSMVARLRAFMADDSVDPSCGSPGRQMVEETRISIADLVEPLREAPPIVNDTNAVEGSKLLLKYVQDLYARIAERRGCSVEAAQMLCNYSPAQLRKMAA